MSPPDPMRTESIAVHTLDEAATIQRVKKSWLERQAAARKIPFTRLGGAAAPAPSVDAEQAMSGAARFREHRRFARPAA